MRAYDMQKTSRAMLSRGISGIAAKGYIDSAVFIERQNVLSIEQEMSIEQIIVRDGCEVTFRLKNRLELTERLGEQPKSASGDANFEPFFCCIPLLPMWI